MDVPVFRDTHPPLTSLYLSLVMWLSASSGETALHLGFIVFPLLAGVSAYALGRRFTDGSSLAAALLLLAAPAFMVMSHNLMGDVPMTAFWLAATAAYIHGVDKGDRLLLALAGVLATLAVAAGYQALALLLLLPAYALLKGRLRWQTVWPLLLPLGAFALFAVYNLAEYGALPRFTHEQGLSVRSADLLDRTQGALLKIGGASVFPLLLLVIYGFRRPGRWPLALAVTLAAAAGLYRFTAGQLPASATVFFTVFLAAGLVVFLVTGAELGSQLNRLRRGMRADRDFIYLAGWLFVITGGIILLLPHATTKYYLPVLAPLILLLLREMRRLPVGRRAFRGLTAAALVLTLAAGLGVSAADYSWAKSYKDFALGLGERYQTDGEVWFVGEWGFRHYMESQGYRYLTSASEAPAEGDLVVTTSLMDWPLAESVRARLEPLETMEADGRLPLTVMGFEASAGFYGSHWGDLPYAASRQPLERFEVYRVGAGRLAAGGSD